MLGLRLFTFILAGLRLLRYLCITRWKAGRNSFPYILYDGYGELREKVAVNVGRYGKKQYQQCIEQCSNLTNVSVLVVSIVILSQ